MRFKTWVNSQNKKFKVFQVYFSKYALAFAVVPYPWVEKGYDFGGLSTLSTFAFCGWISPVTFGLRLFWLSFGIRLKHRTDYYSVPFIA